MTDQLPAWAIAQALKEWREGMPDSGYRNEVQQQIESRAREILARPPPGQSVIHEVVAERARQDAKWGIQNHPDLPPWPDAKAEPNAWFGIPSADEARDACESAFTNKRGSYAHIFVEEVCEAIEAAPDPTKLREELIQCAAVAVAWVECIDRRKAKEST